MQITFNVFYSRLDDRVRLRKFNEVTPFIKLRRGKTISFFFQFPQRICYAWNLENVKKVRIVKHHITIRSWWLHEVLNLFTNLRKSELFMSLFTQLPCPHASVHSPLIIWHALNDENNVPLEIKCHLDIPSLVLSFRFT